MAFQTASQVAATPSAGGGGWWEPIINIGAQVLGSVAGASIANNGIDKQVDASREASAAATQLQRETRDINLALNKPYYQGGGNAFNMLSRIYGMPTQNFSYPTGNSFGTGSATDGSQMLPNYGAGQAVQGHSGGNGQGAAIGSALGAAAGSFLPVVGPWVGSALGGLAGGLIGGRGGDNWQTLATQAPAGYDYDAYFASDPGLASEWAKKDVRSLFNNNRDAYLSWHARGGDGAWAPTELTKLPGADKSTQPVGGAELAGQSGDNSFLTADPLQLFWDSPYGKLATDQFLTVDNPAIKGSFSTAGKGVSGAQQKALANVGRATGGNAFNNYTSGLSQMAGLGPMASTQMQNASNTFATNAGNNMINAGNVAGQAAAARNSNWSNAFNNAATGAYDYAKGAGWV